MSIHSYRFLMHQILKMKLPTMSLLRIQQITSCLKIRAIQSFLSEFMEDWSSGEGVGFPFQGFKGPKSTQSFIIPRSIKWIPRNSGDLVIKSKLFPHSGSVPLRQLSPSIKRGHKVFFWVKTYQIDLHSRTCWTYNKNECCFLYGQYFSEKTIVGKLLGSKFSSNKRKEVLTWRNAVLRQVKSYVDNNLNSTKVNVIDPTKDNFTQPLTIKETLDELLLSISTDKDLQLHLNRL